MSRLIVYTDGACSGNPGPGGWGAILIWENDRVVELGGGESGTTNNRMEILATTRALEEISSSGTKDEIHFYTDSKYVLGGVQGWLFGWKKNGWKTKEGKEVKNEDLWKELDQVLAKVKKINWHHVPGHEGYPGNERADQIAVSYTKGVSPKLFTGDWSAYPIRKSLEGNLDAKVPSGAKAKKFSKPIYLSLVAGELQEHASWGECENRVAGRSGAKYKKVKNEIEREQTLEKWGVKAR